MIPFQLTIEECEYLVKLARRSVTEYLTCEEFLEIPKDVPTRLMELCGVFVTLNSLSDRGRMLRGCIGFPYPTKPLVEALIRAAVSAAVEDFRFPVVKSDELERIIFEVSVLTPPTLVQVEKPTDYPSKIKVGRDGLIVERGYKKGLLLPQVPVELEWSTEEFLCQTAMKAGLTPDAWLLEGTKIHRFSSIIAHELTPNGKIEAKDMRKH